MALSDLTSREAVLAAISEFDQLGRERFLQKYGFRPARRYALEHDGRTYDPKAIAGVAHRYQFPNLGPLKAADFTGGEETVNPRLKALGFKISTIASDSDPAFISSEDLELLRASRVHARYSELTPEQREAYDRVHTALNALGGVVLQSLMARGGFTLKLTSSFTPASGIRGSLPKDLWFAVSNDRNQEAFVRMPQLYMIVSERGIEYGFAAAIPPSDFSNAEFRRRVLEAAPKIFAAMPGVDSPITAELAVALNRSGSWLFRRKTRLDPGVGDYPSLDGWLRFLKSPEGAAAASGSICRYLSSSDLERADLSLQSVVRETAEIFGPIMQIVVPAPSAVPPSPNIIAPAIEQLLDRLPEVRSTTPFGQHEEVKQLMEVIRKGLENLPALRKHADVRVSWSLGVGNWAKIPWIALMDHRETTSTQRGRYCVFLFPEDMSGVYLTLNQGVTDIIRDKGAADGRDELRKRAQAMRNGITSLAANGFSIDDKIDLRTEANLGINYEHSTVAYKFYSRGKVPDDAQIETDITNLLDSYEQILSEGYATGPAPTMWIFQANPDFYDIDSALKSLPEITWLVSQHKSLIKEGDRVVLWRSGSQAGAIALATILSNPAEISEPEIEKAFTLEPSKFEGSRLCVRLRVDRRFDDPIPRERIAADAILKSMSIITAPRGTNFAVTPEQADRLMTLIREIKSIPKEEAKCVWVYEPGRNAEHWDEFCRDGIVAIGWDDIGDFRQYKALDEMYDVHTTTYHRETRPNNDALACWEFATKMAAGDLVFARQGVQTVLGYGIVTGDYEWRSQRAYYKSVRTIRWEGSGKWIYHGQFPVKALTEITNDAARVEELEKLVSAGVGPPPVPQPIAKAPSYSVEDFSAKTALPAEIIRQWQARLERKQHVIFQGPPGTGKTYYAELLARLLVSNTFGFVETVQFHPSYSYEDFIHGIRPVVVNSQLTFEPMPGRFVLFCKKAEGLPDTSPCVLIIDEINRGNLSRIFGELMYLFEYRDKEISLAGRDRPFCIPRNVFVIGTMNTADRSIALVDHALRRRFSFIHLGPDYDVLRSKLNKGGLPGGLVEALQAVNAAIEDRNYEVGISFFLKDGEQLRHCLRDVWEGEIEPYLEEYFYDQPGKIEPFRWKNLVSGLLAGWKEDK